MPYRRRQVAVAVVVVALVLAALALGGAPPSIAGQEAGRAPVTVVVGPGETVWDLVADHVPAGSDRMAYAAAVAAHNRIDARALRPGMVLELPR